MVYYNKHRYPYLLTDGDVRDMEAKFGIKCLYGGLIGSNVYGTANITSDYDFAFVFADADRSADYISFRNLDATLEWNGFNIKLLERNKSLGLESIKKFPSFYTKYRRTPKEDIPPNFMAVCSDYIWDSGYLKDNLPQVVEDMESLLVIDYYFNRAAGNLEKNLSLENVLTKRVIQTVLYMNFIMWILERRTLPYLGFREMTRKFHDEEIGERILNILRIHQDASRGCPPPTIPRDEILNQYIKCSLMKLENQIKKISWNSFEITLDTDCFLGKLVQSGKLYD